MHVLCDQGLGSRELWRQITDLGGGPGTLRVGTGTAFGRDPMPRNRLWARVWLIPVPGPNLAGDLRCLSPPAPA